MSRNDPDHQLPVSACVITLNEEDHIERCLQSISWVDEMVVVDSGSDDRTVEIAENLGARVIHNDWPGFLRQKQFATNRASHDWILSLDADEWVSSELASSIQSLFKEGPPSPSTGFQVNRLSWYLDRWMYHGGWQPDWILRIFNRTETEWGGQDPHAHVVPTEHVEKLDGYLLHDPYEDLSDHMTYLDRYTTKMAQEKHEEGKTATLFTACTHAWWKFWRDYLLKRGILDGSSGFINASMASFYVFLKYTKLRQLSTDNTPTNPPEEPDDT
jgi:glycosyltransferase involved in cell wall biosynthesis